MGASLEGLHALLSIARSLEQPNHQEALNNFQRAYGLSIDCLDLNNGEVAR